jgi:serine/threonine protein kinase
MNAGRYRVLGRLAAGSTTDALLARAEYEGGPDLVVLKSVLQQVRQDGNFQASIAREIATYRQLSHPAVVRLHDIFSDGARLVMAFEHVDGTPLSEMLVELARRNRRLGDSAAIFLGWRVFSALAAAHAAKDPESGAPAPIVHRNVNPANILVPADGDVKLADFGIASFTGRFGTQVMLTQGLTYKAPEQVRGKPPTPHTDVYAASLVLWELFMGRKAFPDTGSPKDLLALGDPKLPPLASERPDLPRPLLEAIAAGLEPDRERRTIEAAQMSEILRASADLARGKSELAETLAALRQPGSAQGEVAAAKPSSPPPGAAAARPTPLTIALQPPPKKQKFPAWAIALLIAVPLAGIAAIVVAAGLRSTTSSPSAVGVTASAAGSAPSGVGNVVVPPEKKGNPVWIDEHLVGESPGSFQVACGLHSVRIGSAGAAQQVSVPCGGDVAVLR